MSKKIDRSLIKQRGIKRLIKSFGYAKEGIKYTILYEQNFLIHIIIALLVLICGFLFKITLLEWVLLVIAIALVLVSELINSSVEAITDLITLEENKLAKIAKDTASGAVFVMAMLSILIGLIIFVPYLLKMFNIGG